MYKTCLQDKELLSKCPKSTGFILARAEAYLQPLLEQLDAQLDKRLVRTFSQVFIVIMAFRNRSMGLLLTELGKFICGFQHACAGVKRISNLLRSKNWEHTIIEGFWLERCEACMEQLQQQGKRVLMLWDDSVMEKPESWFSEGLCSVGSSKGKRLTKVKRGFYKPPTSRICVPGFEWSSAILTALGEVPCLASMRWWTTRGKHKDSRDNVFFCMLRTLSERLGNRLLHVLDRGYASLPTLERFLRFDQHFLIRWKAKMNLVDEHGKIKLVHQHARSHKGQHARIVWDKERKKMRRVSITFLPVTHPELPEQQLFLIIVRDKNNHTSPMYLLTNIFVDSIGIAWELFFSYMHRWSIEQTFRFCKTELAMESPRLWFFHNRLKLLAMVALVYDFLLSLWRDWKQWAKTFTNNWAPRTGKRHQKVLIPLYRFRQAISIALNFLFFLNSG